jgi:anaerobic dimethyl sulfoxide reductase subunit A
MSKNVEMALSRSPRGGISRRAFLKFAGILAASSSLYGCTSSLVEKKIGTGLGGQDDTGEQIIITGSTWDCGGKCFIKGHVKDGTVTRISTRTDAELDPTQPVMKACVRGRSYRKMLYHPDRLKYPMKRVGKRGEGKFERISWEEAIDTIARETIRITEKYGPASRFIHVGTAVTGGPISGVNYATRLFNLTGGYQSYYHSVSMGNTAVGTTYTYGTSRSGSSMATLLHSKLVILWGHNPTETIFGHSNYYYNELKKKGVKFVVIDPRYSDTVAAYADEWIPILPTTDNAMMDAMAYVIVTEGLQDQEFLDKYCLGFDEDHMPEGTPANESWMAYIMGQQDGIEKTPEWAEAICKVPADKIRQLAREYALAKPAALVQGWGPERHASGERNARGGAALACLTGNVGKLGAWASGYAGVIGRHFLAPIPTFENPIKGSINVMNWVDAIANPENVTPANGLVEAEKLETPIKLIYNLAGNYLLNQHPDINRTKKVIEDESLVEFIVVSDHFMTPSAKYADILLPENTFFERWNFGETWSSGNYFFLSQKMVENLYESRSDYEWLSGVAEKMGVGPEFTEGRDELAWAQFLLDETRKEEPTVPSWEQLKKQGLFIFPDTGTLVAFQEQIEDPEANPFPTPSGKIELFSPALYEMKNEEIPAVAHYVPSWEGPQDPLTEKYPLQLIGWKNKHRDNSTFYSHPWLKQVAPQVMWINPADAARRGIEDGERVKVYNDRGATMIEVKVTPRIIPGVVAMGVGSWYNPDANGVDQAGCLNVLTTQRPTALAHGNAHHTNLVEVTKI